MTPSKGAEFDEDAIQSACHFRQLMDAMARPGKVTALGNFDLSAGSLNDGSVIIAETLCDHETTVWLDNDLDGAAERNLLSFRCGTHQVVEPDDADFAFFSAMPDGKLLRTLKTGTPQYPDRSATAVIQVGKITKGDGFTLQGPGIRNRHNLAVEGLSPEFAAWWQDNRSLFPLGVDVYLTTHDALVALPRTVQIMGDAGCM